MCVVKVELFAKVAPDKFLGCFTCFEVKTHIIQFHFLVCGQLHQTFTSLLHQKFTSLCFTYCHNCTNFSWTSNVYLCTLPFNFCLIFQFWSWLPVNYWAEIGSSSTYLMRRSRSHCRQPTGDIVVNPVVRCHYLPSHRASPPFGQYKIILLGDRGICVWTTCQQL